MGRAEFVRADIRNPLISKVISTAKVDTVVHASITAHPAGPTGRLLHKEMNVIGTMQLLAACQRSRAGAQAGGQVDRRRLRCRRARPGGVHRGHGDQGAALQRLRQGQRRGRGLRARLRPAASRRRDHDAAVHQPDRTAGRHRADQVLRAARRGADGVRPGRAVADCCTPRTRSPCCTGRSPHDLPGVFNVGGDGVLLLSQAIRRAGRIPLPCPSRSWRRSTRLFRSTRLVDFGPEQLRYLNFGRVVDTTRLKKVFGFTPRWTHPAGVRRLRQRPGLAAGARSGSAVAALERSASLANRALTLVHPVRNESAERKGQRSGGSTRDPTARQHRPAPRRYAARRAQRTPAPIAGPARASPRR